MDAKPNRDDGQGKSSPREEGSARKAGKSGDSVGRVLKSVYDETLREDIPDDFRDLLSKLG